MPRSRAAGRATPRGERTGRSSSRSPRSSVSAQARSRSRKSPRNRATTSSPEPASASRNGRGSRRPKKLPACVMRKRSDGPRSSPATSSKSAPFGIVTTGPVGSSARVSSEIASETHVIAFARLATSRATWPWSAAFALVAVVSARRCAWATSESRRSATQRIPVARAIAAAIRWVEPGRRGRDDDVDPVLAHEPDPGRDRRQRPGRVLVRDDEPSQLKPRLGQRALDALGAREHLGRLAAAHADVARAVHPRLRRHPRPSSRWSQRGSSGASTCVSIPSPGGTARA